MPLVCGVYSTLHGHAKRSKTRAERSILKGAVGRYAVSLCHAVLSWRMVLLLSGSPGLGPRHLFFNLCSPSSHLSTTDILAAILYHVCVLETTESS